MSTKIYDGKRLPDMSVLELYQFCQKLKNELLPIAKTEYLKIIAHITQSAYMYMISGQNICEYPVDMTKLGKPGTDFSQHEVFFFAKQQAEELVTNTSNAIRRVDSVSEADFDVTICVFPLPDKTLCIPYANHDALRDLLFNAEEFTEYAYWNNTDPPVGLHDDEWEQRRTDWDIALPGLGVPRDSGLMLKIIEAPYDIVRKTYVYLDDVMPYFASDDDLCESFARKSIYEREFQKHVEELGGDWIRHGYKCLRKAKEYINTHSDEIASVANELKNTVRCSEFFKSEAE